MAYAIVLRFDIRDDSGKTSFTKIRVPTTFSVSQVVEFGQAMAQLIANLSIGEVYRAGITFALDLSGLGLKVAAAAAADIYEKARFQFQTGVTRFRAFFRLPTWDETLTNLGSDTVDTSDVDVAALIAGMENGIAVIGPATIQPSDGRGNDIVSLQFAKEIRTKKT